jgi:hypothetical protein
MFLVEKLYSKDANITVTESLNEATGKKDLYLEGIFIQGDVRNENKRVYPTSEIKNAVKQINDQIENGLTVWGEADHPEELQINIDRVSHMITEMRMNGNDGIGKLKIIDTPMGRIIRTMIEAGGKLGVSSRGSGNVDERGNVSDFEIITVDIVARPSAPNAYPKPIYEAFNWKKGNEVEKLAKAIKDDPSAKEGLNTLIMEWIGKINS